MAWRNRDYARTLSGTAFGNVAATERRTRAAPSGFRLPCTHFRSVEEGTSIGVVQNIRHLDGHNDKLGCNPCHDNRAYCIKTFHRHSLDFGLLKPGACVKELFNDSKAQSSGAKCNQRKAGSRRPPESGPLQCRAMRDSFHTANDACRDTHCCRDGHVQSRSTGCHLNKHHDCRSTADSRSVENCFLSGAACIDP